MPKKKYPSDPARRKAIAKGRLRKMRKIARERWQERRVKLKQATDAILLEENIDSHTSQQFSLRERKKKGEDIVNAAQDLLASIRAKKRSVREKKDRVLLSFLERMTKTLIEKYKPLSRISEETLRREDIGNLIQKYNHTREKIIEIPEPWFVVGKTITKEQENSIRARLQHLEELCTTTQRMIELKRKYPQDPNIESQFPQESMPIFIRHRNQLAFRIISLERQFLLLKFPKHFISEGEIAYDA